MTFPFLKVLKHGFLRWFKYVLLMGKEGKVDDFSSQFPEKIISCYTRVLHFGYLTSKHIFKNIFTCESKSKISL